MPKNSIFSSTKTYHMMYGMVGVSSAMCDLFNIIPQIAKSNAPVIIQGETGTGKELCARAIHDNSKRKGNFVVINCAAIPEQLVESELFGHVKGAFTGAISAKSGLVAEAKKGTLFLDEIGELPQNIQAKLLRFLEDGSYRPIGSTNSLVSNARIVSATNRNLLAEIKANNFREDLYYRLSVLDINIPPLRERKQDILPLTEYFMHKFIIEENKSMYHFTQRANNILLQYNWPGNIRELQNVLRRIVVLNGDIAITGKVISNYLNSIKLKENKNTPTPLWEVEKQAIEETLNFCDGNISKAAVFLGINSSTIHRKKAEWQQGDRTRYNA